MSLLDAALIVLAQVEPTGTPEQLLRYRLAEAVRSSTAPDPSVEARGLASLSLPSRYLATLLLVRECTETGRGFESTYNALIRLSTSASGKDVEHLRALAVSFKAALRCRDCKDGKVTCPKCAGKGRVDNACSVCGGAGRLRPPSAVGATDVTFKCRNC